MFLTAAFSLFLWVERPLHFDNPKNLPEINDKSNKIYRLTGINEYSAMVRDKEMPESFPKQARIAQEILARTYYMQNSKDLVSSTDFFQVFKFSNSVNPFKANLIVSNADNLEYHSRCPGFTLVPNGKKIACPLHSKKPFIWKYQIKTNEFDLYVTVLKMLKTKSINKKRRLRLPHRKKIKSPFIVSFDNNSGVITGKGHGHGFGLCQWGAKYLADRGRNYKQIIRHYYPNSYLRRM